MRVKKTMAAEIDLGLDKPRPYAGAFWFFDRSHDQTEVKISIGWAMPFFGDYESGALTIRTKSNSGTETIEPFLPFIEEALGVVHNSPSTTERDLNAHFERLAADYLLFLVHRVLFGQCKRIWSGVCGDPDTVDEMLLFGPALPKFRGRIGYTHLSRNKTVAVIAPDCRFGRVPAQASGLWTQEPKPAFSHDCSSRTWRADLTMPKDPTKHRIASFDIILSTGDGLSTSADDGLPRGSALWNKKASSIQDHLDKDREMVRLSMWKNEEVFLPRGIARAARAAVLNDPVTSASDQLPKVLGGATGDTRKLYQQIQETLANHEFTGTDKEVESLRKLIYFTAIELDKSRTSPGSMAKRDTRQPKELITKAIEKIKDELGDYTIQIGH
jgi:hypothetical protein